MTEAVIAAEGTLRRRRRGRRTYWWCACGRSASQPFCDGSHKVTGITPVRYDATVSGRTWFCACKRSGPRAAVRRHAPAALRSRPVRTPRGPQRRTMIFTARYDQGASRLELAGDCRMADAPVLEQALAALRTAPPAALTVRLAAGQAARHRSRLAAARHARRLRSRGAG